MTELAVTTETEIQTVEVDGGTVTISTVETVATVEVDGQAVAVTSTLNNVATDITSERTVVESSVEVRTLRDTTGAGGPSFGSIAVASQDTVVASIASDTLTLIAGSGMTITTDALTGAVTFVSAGGGSSYTDEDAQDAVGAMVSGNTETRISVSYDDTANKLNFVVDNDLGNYDSTNLSITASQVTDFDTAVSANADVAANTAARHVAVTVLDSSEINFTLAGQQITASLIAGSIDETKLDTSVNASLGLADSSVQPGDNVSSLTNDAGYITSTLSQEEVEDYAGSLVATGGTKTRITVTYQDATGDMDFVVDNDLGNYDSSNLSLTAAQISDFDTEVSNNANVAANTAASHAPVTVLDSSEIDFTLAGQQITASLIAGSIDETKLDTSVNASLDLADSSVQPGDNISQLTNDAGYITATLSQEEIEDYAGALIATGGTKTRITVTYQDATGDVDFVVDNDLGNYDSTNLSITASQVTDFDTAVSANSDVAANTAARHAAVTVLDSSEIDFTLAGQQITASLIAGSIDETKLDTSVNTSLDLADSSVQPGDNVSDLTNDAGYISGNQTITLTGDITGSGTTAITTAISAGAIVNADINASAAIALSKLATQAANTILANATASTGLPTAVTVSPSRVVGRGATGNITEITVGNGVEFNGTSIRRSALTGDVTAAAGSNTTAIAAGVIVNSDVNAAAAIALTKLAATTSSRALVSDSSGFVAVATTTSTEIGYVSGVTSSIQTQIDGKQTLDATLTALAAYNTSGFVTQTAADTFAGRSIAVTPSTGLSISNGDGVSGNPTLSGIDATDTVKGVASFASQDFDVTSGAVALSDTVLKAVSGDTGSIPGTAHEFTIAGTGLASTSAALNTVTVDVPVQDLSDILSVANITDGNDIFVSSGDVLDFNSACDVFHDGADMVINPSTGRLVVGQSSSVVDKELLVFKLGVGGSTPTSNDYIRGVVSTTTARGVLNFGINKSGSNGTVANITSTATFSGTATGGLIASYNGEAELAGSSPTGGFSVLAIRGTTKLDDSVDLASGTHTFYGANYLWSGFGGSHTGGTVNIYGVKVDALPTPTGVTLTKWGMYTDDRMRGQSLVLAGDFGSGVTSTLTLTNDVSGTPADGVNITKWAKVYDGTTTRYSPLYT